jgi:peptide/nickel transport system permease protein
MTLSRAEERVALPWPLAQARGWPLRLPWLALFCGSVLLAFVLVGVLAPWLAPHDPMAQNLVERLRPPVWQAGGGREHLLGTDGLGRDVLSRLVHGARISLTVVGIAVPLSATLGACLGLLAGYRGGLLAAMAMRAADIQLALPAVLVAVLLAGLMGPSLRNVLIIIVAFGWPSYARVVRGEVLSLRERDFVTAARVLGASDGHIMWRHLLPNFVNSVVVLATIQVAAVVLIEAALSFLGVGVPIGTPSWGMMVAEGRDYIRIAWWLVTFPGLAIALVCLMANLLGDWLRDWIDPRLRHARR